MDRLQPVFKRRDPGDYNTQDLLEGDLIGVPDTQYGEMRYYIYSKGKLLSIESNSSDPGLWLRTVSDEIDGQMYIDSDDPEPKIHTYHGGSI